VSKILDHNETLIKFLCISSWYKLATCKSCFFGLDWHWKSIPACL